MIYVISPYSTPTMTDGDQNDLLVKRYEEVLKYAAHLTNEGKLLYLRLHTTIQWQRSMICLGRIITGKISIMI